MADTIKHFPGHDLPPPRSKSYKAKLELTVIGPYGKAYKRLDVVSTGDKFTDAKRLISQRPCRLQPSQTSRAERPHPLGPLATIQRRPSLPTQDIQLANNTFTKVPQQTSATYPHLVSESNPMCHGLYPLRPYVGHPASATESWGDRLQDLPKQAVPGRPHRRFGHTGEKDERRDDI